MKPTDNKDVFSLATEIVGNTSQSVFLTGKAGTGKTTFLHHIRNTIDKNIIVAAPTGIAAINAGGVTLHSLLQLPFEPFVPNMEGIKKLDYHFKLRKSKIEMLRELELLIIDEVSMLRADMLDAIDHLLRRYRNNQQAFGGVQVLFIGDLFQLPPVVQKSEWEQLKPYYASPFFFHAQVLNGNMPLYIELKTIYRQSDQIFIDILNRIRNNQATTGDLNRLNERYNPTFTPSSEKSYITLCTHNSKADRINNEQLQYLSTQAYSFEGKVNGDFSENAYPTEIRLTLKVGAQIMFVKNDSGEQRRYYNGKLATVSYLSDDKIFIAFEDKSEMELEKETWRNVRYTLNNDSGEIEEEELGYFSQYPIRLAWAITIHKSQGLTFDRVIIDAGQAFAAGQVYVAMSRCTSLDGIVLYSKIHPNSIQTDREALAFAKEEKSFDFLESILEQEKPNYCAIRLKKAFNWATMTRTLRSFYELCSEKKVPDQEETLGLISQMCNRAIEQEEIARNFCKELDRILYAPSQVNVDYLKDRVQKAVTYFHGDIQQYMLSPIYLHLEDIKNKSRIKLYQRRVKEIYAAIINFSQKLENVHYGSVNLTEGLKLANLLVKEESVEKKETGKPKKGDTKLLTLSLFNEGKTIAEIAEERNLKARTIEDHLTGFVASGEMSINRLIENKKLLVLIPFLEKHTEEISLKALKDKLPAEYTYFDVKAVLNHITYIRQGHSASTQE